MRYSSESDTYYALINDVVGENRTLIYHIDREGLSLTRVRWIGEVNKSKFYNVIWDKKLILSFVLRL